jgi:hypothetical protein
MALNLEVLCYLYVDKWTLLSVGKSRTPKYVQQSGERRRHRDLGTDWTGGGSISGEEKDFFDDQIFKTSCGAQ